MKLSEYAKKHNIQYRAAWNRFKAGKIPNAKMVDGHVVIEEQSPFNTKNVIIYARVSSSENKTNLESQAERLCQYATAKGYTIVKVVKEVGSGVNDNRKQLQALLSSDDDWAILIVEHKDRLTRFGFNYISTLMTKMELIDELHFLFNKMHAAGMTTEELFNYYFTKNKENRERQKNNY